jgi:hypothetical protein
MEEDKHRQMVLDIFKSDESRQAYLDACREPFRRARERGTYALAYQREKNFLKKYASEKEVEDLFRDFLDETKEELTGEEVKCPTCGRALE